MVKTSALEGKFVGKFSRTHLVRAASAKTQANVHKLQRFDTSVEATRELRELLKGLGEDDVDSIMMVITKIMTTSIMKTTRVKIAVLLTIMSVGIAAISNASL